MICVKYCGRSGVPSLRKLGSPCEAGACACTEVLPWAGDRGQSDFGDPNTAGAALNQCGSVLQLGDDRARSIRDRPLKDRRVEFQKAVARKLGYMQEAGARKEIV